MNYEDKLRQEAEAKLKETQRLSSNPEAINPIEDKERQPKPQVPGMVIGKILQIIFTGCIALTLFLAVIAVILPVRLYEYFSSYQNGEQPVEGQPCPLTQGLQKSVDQGIIEQKGMTYENGLTNYEFETQGVKFNIVFNENCDLVMNQSGPADQ